MLPLYQLITPHPIKLHMYNLHVLVHVYQLLTPHLGQLCMYMYMLLLYLSHMLDVTIVSIPYVGHYYITPHLGQLYMYMYMLLLYLSHMLDVTILLHIWDNYACTCICYYCIYPICWTLLYYSTSGTVIHVHVYVTIVSIPYVGRYYITPHLGQLYM